MQIWVWLMCIYCLELLQNIIFHILLRASVHWIKLYVKADLLISISYQELQDLKNLPTLTGDDWNFYNMNFSSLSRIMITFLLIQVPVSVLLLPALPRKPILQLLL